MLDFPFARQQRTRDVVATLASSLCRLRGLPLPTERDLDALLRAPVSRCSGAAVVTPEDRLDVLIGQLDRLVMTRSDVRPKA